MDITFQWHKPALLRPAKPDEGLIYVCDELHHFPDKPGVYIFVRRHGGTVNPLYVGRSLNLRKRIAQHLENDVRLLQGLRPEVSGNGQRLILIGQFIPRPGQNAAKVTKLVERMYIDYATAAGFDLLNISLTRTPIHVVRSEGRRDSHFPFPRQMKMKIR